MDWFSLSLICAFALASSDAAAKHWLRSADALEMLVVRLGLSGLLLSPWVMTFDLPALQDAIGRIHAGTFKQGEVPPLWDGHATERVVEALAKVL